MSAVDRVALVTGAGRGMGRAHALALAATATVVVNDVGGDSHGTSSDTTPAEAVAEEIRAKGGRAIADFTDISVWDEARRLIGRTVDRFGRLDVIVNNAGVSRTGTLGNLTEDDWARQFHVNVKGPTALLDAAARWWRDQPAAPRAVVNTSSPAGVHPIPPIGVYSATKAAVGSLTVSAARELAPLGVRVNGVVPIARTRLIDHAPQEVRDHMRPREGFDPFLPEHVSRVVEYLASPECRFTGRLLGSLGDQVYLFREWSADYQIGNDGAEWTREALFIEMARLPVQDRYWGMSAYGRHEIFSPPQDVLDHLGAGAGDD